MYLTVQQQSSHEIIHVTVFRNIFLVLHVSIFSNRCESSPKNYLWSNQKSGSSSVSSWRMLCNWRFWSTIRSLKPLRFWVLQLLLKSTSSTLWKISASVSTTLLSLGLFCWDNRSNHSAKMLLLLFCKVHHCGTVTRSGTFGVCWQEQNTTWRFYIDFSYYFVLQILQPYNPATLEMRSNVAFFVSKGIHPEILLQWVTGGKEVGCEGIIEIGVSRTICWKGA